MSKRKDAVALFDLISKGKAERTPGLSVPGWFSKRPAPAPTSQDAGAPEPPPMPEPSPFSATTPVEPMVAVVDNHVKITLNYAGCAIAGAGLVLAMIVFFWLGRISGRPPAVAAGGGPNPAGTPPRAGGAEANAAAPVAAERVVGKYYLIIDRTRGMADDDKLDAEAIVAYCQRNGYPCGVVKDATNHCWAVLSLKPFNSPNGQDALDFAKTVEDLGKRYIPPRGRAKYTFSQARAGRLDPSYYKWTG